MSSFQRLTACFLMTCLLISQTNSLCAQGCSTGGEGYENCRSCPAMTPAVASAAVLFIAIVAVAVQNTNTSHSHDASTSS